MDWVPFLGLLGDPIEKEGVTQHNLGVTFPRYAEYWATYVLPNRDPYDSSKLREGFPEEIEDILNNHYYVFYQMNIVFRQIRDFSNPVLDVGDPLYHLGTSIDLIERTFVAALRVRNELTGNPLFNELSAAEYDEQVDDFWAKEYLKQFKKFGQNYRPVSINFHNASDIFRHNLPKTPAKKDLQDIAGQIRNYRNVIAHSLPPLKLIDKGVKYLPKQNFLDKYVDGRWSSGRDQIEKQDYAPAVEIIEELALKLVGTVNILWEILLTVMNDIATHPKYEGVFVPIDKLFSSSKSGESPISDLNRQNYMGGSADYIPPTGYNLPTTPSGYKPMYKSDPDENSDF